MARIGKHAVVIGASMGGLMAARALSDFYDEVTIVDRDALPGANTPRKGAPQGRHAHGLLARGSQTLAEMFPGFANDILAEGGLVCDADNECVWFDFGRILKAEPSDISGLLASRPTLENVVRRRVSQLPNARIRPSTDAVEPRFDAAGGRVTGLSVRPTGSSEAGDTIGADFVVDSGGRGARNPTWLERLNYPKPTEETVRVEIGYMSRHYRRRPGQLSGKKAVILAACPPGWRIGAALAQDGDRWIVTIGGHFGDRAPDDDAGFLAFARSLQSPEIYEIIKDAQPLDDLTPYNRLTIFPPAFADDTRSLRASPRAILCSATRCAASIHLWPRHVGGGDGGADPP